MNKSRRRGENGLNFDMVHGSLVEKVKFNLRGVAVGAFLR